MSRWRSTMTALLLVAGGVLTVTQREELPQGLSILETSTIATVRPASQRLALDHFAHWPYVKGLVPHHSPYSFGRMQNVWLDR